MTLEAGFGFRKNLDMHDNPETLEDSVCGLGMWHLLTPQGKEGSTLFAVSTLTAT